MKPLAMKFPEWKRVAEVELVYKTKVKACKWHKISSVKDCY